MPPSTFDLPILFQSDHELVVIKPAGLSCEKPSTAGTREGDPESLIDIVRAHAEWAAAKLPHRLDRMARGIVVIAMSDPAIAFHNEMIRLRRWEKYYLARIPAHDDARSILGSHRVHLRREGRRSRVVRSGGQPASMRILSIASAPDSPGQAHVLIHLETGRYHQIRIMLAHLGVPLVGDELYGSPYPRETPYLEHIVLKLPLYPAGDVATMHAAEDRARESLDDAMFTAVGGVLGAAPQAGSVHPHAGPD
jgi:23S rRNA-/tRNA-specific pseudouridylate synthase